jgi:hemolysin activation/secretion protein
MKSPRDLDMELVEAYLARLKPGSVLKVRDVERVVFLVNDLRGMTARFEVKAGSVPGTATLVVTPSPEQVYTGKIDLDANGAKALGEFRLGGLAQMNSPFGRGDALRKRERIARSDLAKVGIHPSPDHADTTPEPVPGLLAGRDDGTGPLVSHAQRLAKAG